MSNPTQIIILYQGLQLAIDSQMQIS